VRANNRPIVERPEHVGFDEATGALSDRPAGGRKILRLDGAKGGDDVERRSQGRRGEALVAEPEADQVVGGHANSERIGRPLPSRVT
jgi:hypothetical protein